MVKRPNFRNFIVANQSVMKKFKPLDQKGPISADALNHTSKVQNIIESKGRILEGLKEFASSVSDFRRTDKGNIRHRLEDIILRMVFARASKCVGRTDIIEFGRHNLNKLRKIGILKNGVPSEATLCRIENGINERDMACRMQSSPKSITVSCLTDAVSGK